MECDNISPLIEIMLKSAFYSDESEIGTDPYLNYLGLGKVVYSINVREGIKDIIDLMEKKRALVQSNEYLKDLLENYKDIGKEIIDPNDFELLTDEEKIKIKKYIDNILGKDEEHEGWYENNNK